MSGSGAGSQLGVTALKGRLKGARKMGPVVRPISLFFPNAPPQCIYRTALTIDGQILTSSVIVLRTS
jgi:hypothetical protein